MLFPSIDVISVYPLFILTVINNVYIVLFGRDSAQAKREVENHSLFCYQMKFVGAPPPTLSCYVCV